MVIRDLLYAPYGAYEVFAAFVQAACSSRSPQSTFRNLGDDDGSKTTVREMGSHGGAEGDPDLGRQVCEYVIMARQDATSLASRAAWGWVVRHSVR